MIECREMIWGNGFTYFNFYSARSRPARPPPEALVKNRALSMAHSHLGPKIWQPEVGAGTQHSRQTRRIQ
jgi:hypothetical protein